MMDIKLSRNRKALIASLKLSRVTPTKVASIWTKYETGIHSVIKTNGKRFALERYKECYAFLRNHLLQLPTQPLSFCKVDAEGIPKPLWPLRPLLKGDRNEQRLALTIARTFEFIKLEVNYDDLDNIIVGVNAETAKRQRYITKKFNWFLTKFTRKYPWYLGSLQTPIQPWGKVLTTLSKGPNGPAVATSHLDAKAVIKDRVLYHNLRKLNNVLGQSWITRWLEGQAFSFSSDTEYLTGRLGFSAEPAGKTRVFAIGDYWSQLSLKTLQISLHRTLTQIRTDCTANQNEGFSSLIKESCNNPTYCFDLTSASDRIPAKMQKKRLELMGGSELADSWHQVMTNRDFVVKQTKRKVRWAIGQPLGLLSSFPSFALWHHDIVQLAANWELLLTGKPLKFFSGYRLLGDDIVIFDHKVARRYQWLLSNIGISINMTKSVIGDKRNSQIEFTKRLALKGREYSSIKMNVLDGNNMLNMLDLVEILIERDFTLHDTGHRGLLNILKSKELQHLQYLLWLRSSDEPRLILSDKQGNPSLMFNREEVMQNIISARAANIIEKAEKVRPLDMETEKPHIEKELTSSCVPYDGRVLEDRSIGSLSGSHPLVLALTQTSRELQFLMFTVLDDLEPDTVSPVEYLPVVSTKSYFSDRKTAKIYLSKILLGAFNECQRKALEEQYSVAELQQGK